MTTDGKTISIACPYCRSETERALASLIEKFMMRCPACNKPVLLDRAWALVEIARLQAGRD